MAPVKAINGHEAEKRNLKKHESQEVKSDLKWNIETLQVLADALYACIQIRIWR